MGSRPAPAPVTYIPEPVAPTVFQSVVPEEDFARATQYIQELKTERETAKAERYAEIGTPEEIRARMDKRSKVTEAAYESSLPQPEIDYTAGLDPARLNNLNTFLSKLVERRQGKGKAPAPAPAPKVDTAKAVRQAVQAPAPKVAPRPVPAPAPRPAPRPAPAPAPAAAPAPKTQKVTLFGRSVAEAKRKTPSSIYSMESIWPYTDKQIEQAAIAVDTPNIKTDTDLYKVADYLDTKKYGKPKPRDYDKEELLDSIQMG
jgi:hypothetical protein